MKGDDLVKWFIAVLCWLLAGGVFFGMFFKLAPYICNLVTPGQWQALIKVGIYFAVAYFGGIGLPLILAFFGTIILWQSKESDNF